MATLLRSTCDSRGGWCSGLGRQWRTTTDDTHITRRRLEFEPGARHVGQLSLNAQLSEVFCQDGSFFISPSFRPLLLFFFPIPKCLLLPGRLFWGRRVLIYVILCLEGFLPFGWERGSTFFPGF